MSILKTFMGITLFTTSLTGEAAGKIGRYSSTATEYVSGTGKKWASSFGDTLHNASQTINNWGTNDFITVTSSLTHATGDLAHCASNLLEATEATSKNVALLFGSLESGSQWLRNYSTNLIRDDEYRDLNAKFNFRSVSETSELEDDKEDWDSIKPIINYRDDRQTKKIAFNQSVGRRWMKRTKDCLPSLNPLKV